MSFAVRLKKIIEEHFGGKTRRLAVAAGLRETTLHHYLERGSLPNINIAAKIAIASGVPLHWLATGIDLALPDEPEKVCLAVPLVEGFISGGTGAVPDDRIKDFIYVPQKKLHAAQGQHYVAIAVRGDSMEPELMEGDIVVIDRCDDAKRIERDSLYAVRADDHAFIKRLFLTRDKKEVQLISSNPEYTKKHGMETINLTRQKENPIIGRVIYSIRRWK